MNEKSKDGERFEDHRLEDESVGLEEALDLFEGGMNLARSCKTRLEEVEQRVTQLLENEDNEEEVEEEAE